MSCVICYEECKEIFKIPKDCDCQFLIHKKCHNNLLLFTKISCIYCRKKNKYLVINSVSYIYNLPAPVAVVLWFIFSNLITFTFLIPLILAKLLTKNNENNYSVIFKLLMSFILYYYLIFNIIYLFIY